MKKILKKIITFTIVLFLILGVSIVQASDDEEPIFPKGIDISRSINLMVD